MPKGDGKLTEKQQRAKERKERKLLEQQIKQSKEKFEEGRALLEPEGRAQPQYSKAVQAFDAAIELYPENALAFCFRGHAFRDQEMPPNAIEDYSKAFSLDATNIAALEGRANCYESLQQWDKAINDYTTIISIHPENDHAFNMRGAARLHKRAPGLVLRNADFAAVVDDFKSAIRLNECNYFAHCNLGKAYVDQRMYLKGMEAFSGALRVKEDYTYANFRRGCAALMQVELLLANERKANEAKEAAEANQDASKSALPQTAEEIDAMAAKIIAEQEAAEKSAKERQELLLQAVADFTHLINPDEKQKEPTALIHRGTCYLYLGDLAKAEEDLSFLNKNFPTGEPAEEGEKLPPQSDLNLMRSVLTQRIASVKDQKR